MNSKKRFIFVQDDKRHAEIMKKDLQRTDSDLYHLYCAMEGDSPEAAAVRKANENHLVSEMQHAWENYEGNKARWEANKARAAQCKGIYDSTEERKQAAIDYWKPYQDIYHQHRAAGRKPKEARSDVDKQIKADKSWPPDHMKEPSEEPSQSVLEKWLK